MFGITPSRVAGAILFWVGLGILLLFRSNLYGYKLLMVIGLMALGVLISFFLIGLEIHMTVNGYNLTKEHYLRLKGGLIEKQRELTNVCEELKVCTDCNDIEGTRVWNTIRCELEVEVQREQMVIDLFRKDVAKARNKAFIEGDMETVNKLIF